MHPEKQNASSKKIADKRNLFTAPVFENTMEINIHVVKHVAIRIAGVVPE